MASRLLEIFYGLDLPFAAALAIGLVAVLLVSAALVELVEPRLRLGFLRSMELIVPGGRKAQMSG